jgi:hypothetical protein
MSEINLEDCPFCGHVFFEDEMDDVIYPTNRERTLWQCGCTICTGTVYGISPEHAAEEWNKRTFINRIH